MSLPPDLNFEADRSSAGAMPLAAEALIRQAVLLRGAGTDGHEQPRLVQAAGPAEAGAPDQARTVLPGLGGDHVSPIRRSIHDPTGQRQATQDARQLRHLNNERFVEQIEHDCAVGPHLEWSIAGGTILGKSLVKGWILGKAGESMGPSARMGGIGAGVVIGTITGFYTAYETADLLENSCRAHAYEERLNQTKGGTQTSGGDSGLDPFSHTYDIERGFPSVRTVVDFSKRQVDSIFGKPRHDFGSINFERAMAHNNLNDENYIAWAHKASAVPFAKQAEREVTFVSLGLAGGIFAAKKLHLGLEGTLVMAAGGALAGTGLSYLGIFARENTSLAELLKDRLLSRPLDRPRP